MKWSEYLNNIANRRSQMSDRLLSGAQICQRLCNDGSYAICEPKLREICEKLADSQRIAKAQRDLTAAAVNAEWVKWIETVGKRKNSRYLEITPEHWQERKRSVGL